MMDDEKSREAGLALGEQYRDICWRSCVLLVILASWRIYAGEELSNPQSSSCGTTLSRIKYTEGLGGRGNSYICTRIMLASICQHGVTVEHHAFLIFSASPLVPSMQGCDFASMGSE